MTTIVSGFFLISDLSSNLLISISAAVSPMIFPCWLTVVILGLECLAKIPFEKEITEKFSGILCPFLIYVFKNLLSNKENLKKTLISIGLFLGILLISFILADSSEVNVNGEIVSGTTSKLVSTGIMMFYILGLVSIGTMIWTGLTKFKK